uniref:DUF2655 domain-containing protein n=1 Tax=Strongyloides papillosus TaxID=174720 RepID=A0A0N5CIV7_STREA
MQIDVHAIYSGVDKYCKVHCKHVIQNPGCGWGQEFVVEAVVSLSLLFFAFIFAWASRRYNRYRESQRQIQGDSTGQA